ncbi:hypothetical protein J6590_056587 [Homalodisca vitripennis]|nr:hypothetical protein J6590_056587 [Homalodisca vitripennis]
MLKTVTHTVEFWLRNFGNSFFPVTLLDRSSGVEFHLKTPEYKSKQAMMEKESFELRSKKECGDLYRKEIPGIHLRKCSLENKRGIVSGVLQRDISQYL